MEGRRGIVAGLALAALAVMAGAATVAPAAAADSPASAPGAAVPAPVVLPLLPVDPSTPAPLTGRQRAQLARDLSTPALGPGVAAVVTDATSVRLDREARAFRIPASTLKLLTATASLQTLGPRARLSTSVVLRPAGATQGKGAALVLVGGGDATLQTRDTPGADPSYWRPATLTALARSTARALDERGIRSVRLGYDDALFTGPEVAPSWSPEYVATGVVAPVTALMVDQGLVDPSGGSLARVEDPALAAARRFAELLQDRRIVVRGDVAPAGQSFDVEAAAPVADVESPPLAWLVERMLTDSDNQLAESLARLAALADGRPGSFSGAGATLRQAAVDAAGAPATSRALRILDGSGLSRSDRLSPAVLVLLLRQAVDDPVLRPVLAALPVAGFTGTLADRYRSGPSRVGAGVVRAKTGTLTGVDAQAGLVVDSGGALRLFAFLADETDGDVIASREALDAAASRLVP